MNSHRLFEITGIAAFASLQTWLVVRLLGAVSDSTAGIALGLALFAGYVAADFASGLIHWGFDRYGTVTTPVVGANFIAPFREHHVDPKGITRHDFVETNGNNCIATAPVLVLAHLLPLGEATWALMAAGLLASLTLFVFGTNQFHKWSHEDKPPALVDFLQRAHLILGREHHDVHHSPPFDKYYCITTGWLNPLLTKVRFFERVEAAIFRLTGHRAGEDDAKQVAARVATASHQDAA